MPLSPPDDREPIHQRKVVCQGFRRKDGLWDVEGHIIDTKTYDFQSTERGEVHAGTPVHEMRVRITFDDDFLIHQAEACTEYSPYSICPQAAPSMEKLKGIRMVAGWRREINERVGGTLGCTHLRELLGPMATTAFQTVVPIKTRENKSLPSKRPSLIDSCYAYSAKRNVVKRLWPEYADTESTE